MVQAFISPSIGANREVPVVTGKIATWLLIVFMVCNIAVSGLALMRYDERENNIEASEKWQVWMDNHYNDAKDGKNLS